MLFDRYTRQTELTRAQQQLLRTTIIDERHPGPVLQDFTTLLHFIDEARPQLTGTLQLPLRALAPLNEAMTHPLHHRLSRPQQKSFPHLNGLFWLVRAAGLTYIEAQGIAPEQYPSWEDEERWYEEEVEDEG